MITTIDKVAEQLGVCRRTMYRLIDRVHAEIVYIDNGGKKRLAGINATHEVIDMLREAKNNPRFNPQRPMDNEYRGNVALSLRLRYLNKVTNEYKYVDYDNVVSIDVVNPETFDYYNTKEYLITLRDGSSVKLRSKFNLSK